jgi:hypothetical protein
VPFWPDGITVKAITSVLSQILSIDQYSLLPRSDTVQQIANLLLQKQSDLHQDNYPRVGKL